MNDLDGLFAIPFGDFGVFAAVACRTQKPSIGRAVVDSHVQILLTGSARWFHGSHHDEVASDVIGVWVVVLTTRQGTLHHPFKFSVAVLVFCDAKISGLFFRAVFAYHVSSPFPLEGRAGGCQAGNKEQQVCAHIDLRTLDLT